jgi:hypothetical protein
VLLEEVGAYGGPEVQIHTNYCREILPLLIQAEDDLKEARAAKHDKIPDLVECCNNLALLLRVCYSEINRILHSRSTKAIRAKMAIVEARLDKDYGQLFTVKGI